MVIEIEEKNQEDHSIQADDVEEYWKLVRAVFHEEKLSNMGGHHHKLNLKKNLNKQGSIRGQN